MEVFSSADADTDAFVLTGTAVEAGFGDEGGSGKTSSLTCIMTTVTHKREFREVHEDRRTVIEHTCDALQGWCISLSRVGEIGALRPPSALFSNKSSQNH